MTGIRAWLLAVFAVSTVLGSTPIRPGPRPAPQINPSKDTFFVSAPSEVIPGTRYAVTVDILNGTDVEVTAGLQSLVYNSSTYQTDKTTIKSVTGVFSQGETGRLEMEMAKEFKCPRCELVIQGRGSQVFERAHHVSVKEHILTIFVQTDKAIYKPGQRVRYRAFAVYQDLSIYTGPISLEIREPSNNRMKVESELRDQSGVVQGSFDLDDQPPFGDWTIRVQTEDKGKTQVLSFTVAQYELPRFEVTVDLPPFGLVSESHVVGTVKAKYTYGKPVKGMVDLHVGPDRGPDSCGKMPKTVNIGFEVDGESTFRISHSNIRRVMHSIRAGTRVRITAKVTESATGVTLNGSNAIEFYSVMHTMSFLSSTQNVFKPGLPYKAHVQVKKPDNSPPDQPIKAITMWPHVEARTTVPNQDKYDTSYFSGTFPLEPITEEMAADGIATFTIDIPSNATNIWMKVYYGNNYLTAVKSVGKAYSQSNNYMQLTMVGSDIKSGQTATFQVLGTEPIQSVNYEIIARNFIAKAGKVTGDGQSSLTFDLAMTEDMGPVANLVVYYVRENGEIVGDSISFNVDGIFKNKVSVDFSAEKAEPSNKVQLRVTADPMSNVFLLAVDESVMLLKAGNDVTADLAEQAVSGQKQKDTEYAESSATTIEEVFSTSGLIVITDATLYERPRPRQNMRRFHSYGPPGAAYDDSDMMFSVPQSAKRMPSPIAATSPVQVVTRIRNKFPEAWLWTDVVTNSDGSYLVNTTVPDTITTWVASAFATNQLSGLGVSATKTELTVFQSFFVSLNYPKSIKRNEQAVIQATVFNYLTQAAYVTVSLKDTSGFQHVQISEDVETVVETVEPQRLWVRSDSHGVVYFPIVGKEVGVYDIEIKAQSTLAADGVRRQISIEPEGAPHSINHAIYIDQASGSSVYSEMHSMDFPPSVVPGSKKISVGLSGDIIGPSFDNIDHLLSMPTGCGEQNMLRLAPTLYIAQYLKATGQLTSGMMEEVVDKLSRGYQSQLTYRRSDSSFSAFGNRDESGSTWLTAYVSRVLSEAREFTYVDPKLLVDSVEWLVDRQRADGAFVELGRVIDPNTQGKSTGPALTAYVLLTLHQNRDLFSQRKCEKNVRHCTRTWRWGNATNSAVEYLERSIDNIKDSFSLSVVTYALTQVRSPSFYRAFRKLKGMASNEGGLTCWKGNSTAPDSTPRPNYRDVIWRRPAPRAHPIDTIITGYSLMIYAARGQVKQALPIVRCLTQHRNFMGGFASTQDTSVALQALSAFATKAYDPNNELTVSFELIGGETVTLDIDSSNMLNYQTREFADMEVEMDTYDVEVKAYTRGKGTAVAEINYSFNVLEMPDSDAFDVSTVLLDDNVDNFNLMICTKWLKSEKTGMVVQQIEIPSGFEPDLDTIGNVAGMKRYERRGNKAVVYFDEIVRTSTCYSLLMSRTNKVAKSAKTFVHTYNYYRPEDSSTVFYHPRSLRMSSICQVCPKCCNPSS